ncbi:MAG: aminoacyl-histidine dipeptidase [Dorea sp.]|nr:aminoacyl-histidine dipeptidase [Dorea sp.]
MAVLSELEPKRVFHYFEEICKIPHGSHNTKEISDYCVNFARERNLSVIQDEANNVIIRKPGTEGCEDSETLILQGHLDMVCEKTPDSSHDFEKDGLKLWIQDGYVTAKDTTLGGDDGIAVAMMLAVLDSDEIVHPPLEALFTSDEEVGMGGAGALNMDDLRGKMLINIDSEEEGILTAGCAGGFRFDTVIPVSYEKAEGEALSIVIGGLTGGHSGCEIHKQRGNAHALMGRLLNHLRRQTPLRLAEIVGGKGDNVIAVKSEAKIAVSPKDKETCMNAVRKMERVWKDEFGEDEPGLYVEVTEDKADRVFAQADTNRVISYLSTMQNGVICYERQVEGQVETSLNVGIIQTSEREVIISHLVRSSMESKKWDLKERLFALAELAGGKGEARDEYPAWNYRKDSKLRELMVRVYQEMYGEKPQVLTIHAGLECGLFVGKNPELDCISFGPEILDVHSVNERMNIKSVERSYKYLLEVLKAAK